MPIRLPICIREIGNLYVRHLFTLPIGVANISQRQLISLAQGRQNLPRNQP
jgi:hypothetical protein